MQTIFKTYGLLLMLASLNFLPPLLVELWFKESSILPFLFSFIISFIFGLICWAFFRKHQQPLRTHDGFIIVALFWLSISFVCSFPFCWSSDVNASFTRAFFESVSGITTTGSTLILNLDVLPHAIIYYRQQLQFIGGISIIILAIALLPALGIGGLQLFRNEITGPVKDDKLTPRITHTAKAIWFVYLVLTFVCAGAYALAGMSIFDAICHSFSTVSTGGFSTHDASLGYFHQPAIRIIAILFMCIGAMNFNLHYLSFYHRKLSTYLKDIEWRSFISFILLSCIIVYFTLLFYGSRNYPEASLLDVCFNTISILTTTGFFSKDISLWPGFVPVFILFTCIIGGCTGSTAGGIKIVRALLLRKQGAREIQRLIHPREISVIHLGKTLLSNRIIEAIWGFFVTYCAVFALLLLLLLATNEDFLTSYTALIGCLSNSGRALGYASFSFAPLSDFSLWILSVAMLLGRVEIFTFLVLFSPAFWRR